MRKLTMAGGRASRMAMAAAGVLTCIVWAAVAPAQLADGPQVLALLRPGTDAQAVAAAYGLKASPTLSSDVGLWVLSGTGAAQVQETLASISTDARVLAAEVNRVQTTRQRDAVPFVPNDPYISPAADHPGQWHLINTRTPGLDINVQGAWARGLTGQGVTIGVCDDCLQTNHPDLAPNYSAANSWDFVDNDPDPSPVLQGEMHGTAVAGIAAARGGNSIGVSGVAPHSSVSGLRLLFGGGTTQSFVDATLYKSSGPNPTIQVKNHSYSESESYTPVPLEVAALNTSAAAKTLHVFSAGNYRTSLRGGADCNTRDLQNSPSAITVAAMGYDGKYAYYSSYGACVFVTAPSRTELSELVGIVTTDRTGYDGYNGYSIGPGNDPMIDMDYTSWFGGTSASAPMVAGVMVLGKQVRPNMDVRFAKHLLARTSTLIDPTDSSDTSDGGWKTNAAGYKFNQNYGFGLINADAFTAAAEQYVGVTPPVSQVVGRQTVNAAIPNNSPTGISRSFSLTDTTPLEDILVTLDVTHLWRGELDVFLTSPSGTRGRLLHNDYYDSGDNIAGWELASNTFWGEIPAGAWTLTVADAGFGSTVGTWNWFSVTANMGTLVVPEPGAITLLLGGAWLVLPARRRRHARDSS